MSSDSKQNKQAEHGQVNWEKIFSWISRVFVWSTLFGVLYVLRSFFLLIFLTFVFSYIQAHGVTRLQRRVKNRSLAVTLVGLAFLGVLILIGQFMIPRVVAQAKVFAREHQNYLRLLDDKVYSLAKTYPVMSSLVPEGIDGGQEAPALGHKSFTLRALQELLGIKAEDGSHNNLKEVIDVLGNIGRPLLAIGSAFLLSLLFSFLIVLDLPRLQQSVRSLAFTRLAFVYEEVAHSIKEFAGVMGRAFEAQLWVALANTMLTSGVIYVLDVQDNWAFLSLIVFICSFIPVAGVFISSVPIILLALQVNGVQALVLGPLLIWLVHLAEAYILNPRIYGDRLKINPVLVLIILTVAGKLFHVWGLLLSLPVCTYIFKYAIQLREEE